MKRLLPLMLALGLAACGGAADEAAAPTTPAAEAPAAEAPATEAPAADAPATEAATDAPEAPAETGTDAATPGDTPAAEAPVADANAAAGTMPALPPGPAPREGIDFEVLSSPQPTFTQGAGIEVAEVFSYTCIHCANLQPKLNTWKANLAPDVRFVYVPAVFGGVGDNFARGYYAAEATGQVDKTHDDLFRAVLIERKFQTGSEDEIADWYAGYGADREAFLSTMRSFAVTGKLNRARQFALRTGVNSTPTMIVAGKYRAVATGDRGMEGLLATVDWLVMRERGAGAAAQ